MIFPAARSHCYGSDCDHSFVAGSCRKLGRIPFLVFVFVPSWMLVFLLDTPPVSGNGTSVNQSFIAGRPLAASQGIGIWPNWVDTAGSWWFGLADGLMFSVLCQHQSMDVVCDCCLVRLLIGCIAHLSVWWSHSNIDGRKLLAHIRVGSAPCVMHVTSFWTGWQRSTMWCSLVFL